jgi:hypothetical protein
MVKSYFKFKLDLKDSNRHHEVNGEIRILKDEKYILRLKEANVIRTDKGLYVLASTKDCKVMCIVEARKAIEEDDVPNFRHHLVHKLTPVSIRDVIGSTWGEYVEEVFYMD